ncbi:helix-turn-helix domain-containing protein [Aequorivita sp. KMM 9714]|uniref:helix-turn-helix domain-containing protein n=1 Tax=Aequorivita sp. KMM 9714 TaxID=2707173 RepID=UPI0013ED6531|nr:helix-turn-helix domain-containing protein [Aequorivita sp. KMM 9714]NGX82688.1 helix-turn-helix domain-containing protein [Aequorivita sp. KMM 9714]
MSKKKRLKKISNMLLKMGAGKFFYRLERSLKNDDVEALVLVLNMMSEEIEETLIHQGYVNANETIRHIVLMSFLIDSEGYIEAVNHQACTILFYLCEDIVGQPFHSFLDEASVSKWKENWKVFNQKKLLDSSLELKFRTKESLLVPGACYVNRMRWKNLGKDTFLLTVVKHSKKQVELESNLKQQIVGFNKESKNKLFEISSSQTKEKVRLTNEDIRKIGEARDLLINNLDKDFPSIKEFALQIGTNTFKLKYGFKELYGVSVYRFLRNERLRKAKMLIQYGDRSFKSIAHITGFKSVPHFSRTFKKQFGFTPTELRKKSSFDDE